MQPSIEKSLPWPHSLRLVSTLFHEQEQYMWDSKKSMDDALSNISKRKQTLHHLVFFQSLFAPLNTNSGLLLWSRIHRFPFHSAGRSLNIHSDISVQYVLHNLFDCVVEGANPILIHGQFGFV